jgi:hypothetical protein
MFRRLHRAEVPAGVELLDVNGPHRILLSGRNGGKGADDSEYDDRFCMPCRDLAGSVIHDVSPMGATTDRKLRSSAGAEDREGNGKKQYSILAALRMTA